VWGDIRVSMAGIVSNLILAAFSTLLLAVVLKIQSVSGSLGGTTTLAGQVAYYGILINLVLAFFNLIPLPPLDGSHVLYHALPKALAERYRAAGRHGLLIMMGLLFFFPGVFRYLMWPVSVLMGLATDFARLWL
jgi:Zn-dependent protease